MGVSTKGAWCKEGGGVRYGRGPEGAEPGQWAGLRLGGGATLMEGEHEGGVA